MPVGIINSSILPQRFHPAQDETPENVSQLSRPQCDPSQTLFIFPNKHRSASAMRTITQISHAIYFLLVLELDLDSFPLFPLNDSLVLTRSKSNGLPS